MVKAGVLRAVGITAAVTAIVAGCGGTGSSGHSQRVTSADYGASWPLTVSGGTLGCQNPGAVTFTTDDGTTYWVNGTAGDVADQHGWQDIKPIWQKDPHPVIPGQRLDIGVLIDAGLKLCGS